MIYLVSILLMLAVIQWNVNRGLNRELDTHIASEREHVFLWNKAVAECDSLRKQIRPVFPSVPAQTVILEDHDRVAIAQFLNRTDSGKKMVLMLDELEQYRNRRAILSTGDQIANLNVAKGWHECLAYLKTFSANLTPQDQDSSDGEAQPEAENHRA